MNINDYVIVQAGNNWAKLLADWTPPLPPHFTLWLVNRFGDAFVLSKGAGILRLDVGAGTCIEVADSREHFAQLLDTGDNAQQWLRIALTDACRKAGMSLGPHQCYGFKIPPALGGKYETRNIVATDLTVHYSYLAYISKQTDIYWVPDR